MNPSFEIEHESPFWVKAALPDVHPVVDRTVPELCNDNVQGWGHLVAFECALTGRKYTHNQVYRLSKNFAASLTQNVGIKPEDVIALVLPNCIEYPVVLFGIWSAGCIASPINPAFTEHELKHLMEMSGARVVITLSELAGTLLKLKESCTSMETVITVDGNTAVDGCMLFAEMIGTQSDGPIIKGPSNGATTTDSCLLLFSSGTTGPPKGVMISHTALSTNLLQYSSGVCDRLHPPVDGHAQERLLAVLPFFHIYPMTCLLNYGMFKGCHTMILPKFNPATFTAALRQHGPTFLPLVPPLTTFLVNDSQVYPEDLKDLHTILTAGAPTGKSLRDQFRDKFGERIGFMEGYGLTEILFTHVLSASESIKNGDKIGSVGQLLASTWSKIIDVKSGKPLPRFQEGEVCIKGPQVMKGYLNNEEATRAMIDPEGWLHTGDIGYYDDDNCLYIVGRLKELIKVKGFQVAPAELENLLRSHPKVEDVAVIGIPHENWGELPRGYIVAKGGMDELTAEEIHEFLQDQVTAYKQLRGGIEFIQAIPKSPAGKILRRELLEKYLASCTE